MSWSIGYDGQWKRDIGYGVPAYCDHPGCNAKIDRGLAFVCAGEEPYGGEHGCGLYFCEAHKIYHRKKGSCCFRCAKGGKPFDPKPDHPEWMRHKLTDATWGPWRKQNPDEVFQLHKAILAADLEEAERRWRLINGYSGKSSHKPEFWNFIADHLLPKHAMQINK